MPYISDTIKLNESQDRRRKLSSEQKEEIVKQYATGNYSLMQLAGLYHVSKKTILLIVNTESAARAKEYRQENWRQWQRKGEEWNKIQREHRHYKQQLYLEGKLINNEAE